MTIQNKTLAKEIVVEKAREDQAMKEAIQNRTHDKIKKEEKNMADHDEKASCEMKEKMYMEAKKHKKES
jgi:hypothetical protein